MKKKPLALFLSVLLFSVFLMSAFAVEPLSNDEVVAHKRAWYPFIKTCEEKTYAKAASFQDVNIDNIIVESEKQLTTEDAVKAEISESYFIAKVTAYVHFTAIMDGKSSGYIYTYMPQSNYEDLYSDASSNLTIFNYNWDVSLFASNENSSNCTRLGENYFYNPKFGGTYYIGFDLTDYRNYVPTASTSISSESVTEQPVSSQPAAPAEKYTKDQELIISGKTDFNYFYTYKDGLNCKCFSLTNNGQRFYASVREDLYDYYKNAFKNHSLTLKGKYQFTAEDGSPVISVSTLVEGTKETNLRSYLWTVNKGSAKNLNFKAYADLQGDGLVLTAAKDGQSITINSNPWGASKGSQAYKLDNDLALILIKDLNSELGLPDWLYTEMIGTRALDGRQKEVFDYVTVTWSYHPDNGINILYRKNN